jgi:hypothetical protein
MLPTSVQSPARPSNKRYLLLAFPFAFALLLVAHRSSNLDEGQQLKEYLPSVLGGYSFSSQEGMELSEEWEREEGVEQSEVQWSEEEQRLREYRWETPEVDDTLKRVLEGLDEVRFQSTLQTPVGADPDPLRRAERTPNPGLATHNEASSFSGRGYRTGSCLAARTDTSSATCYPSSRSPFAGRRARIVRRRELREVS